ncbi:FtsK/SpoIIIE domain-containing protein [Streptomyces sp. NRRL F-5123]|uniref:FtsK/SpoIIIE domain-containing protein n=1 Tax=Streptomyces sp. NRRL F-5123 TaxID=1463856 RepID=UPI0006932608|nr:FtsK/SpoIIIE domain-containing protein [Streptomyces sp. NRRL F-5123]
MSRILTVVTVDGVEHDIELYAPESARMWDLSARFGREWAATVRVPESTPVPLSYPRRAGATALRLYAGSEELPPWLTLAESPLRDGVRVGLGKPLVRPPYSVRPADGGQVEATVRIVTGEGAGAEAVVTDEIPRAAALFPRQLAEGDGLVVDFAGEFVRQTNLLVPTVSLGESRVVRATGEPAVPGWEPPARGTVWKEGTLLTVGRSCLLWFRGEPTEFGALPPGDHGTLLLDPRARSSPRPVLDGVPQPPATAPVAPERRYFSYSRAAREVRARRRHQDRLLELVLSAAADVPVLWPRWQERRTLEELADAAVDRLAVSYPDPAALAWDIVRRPATLWQRGPQDADFLALRCGLRTALPAPAEGQSEPDRHSPLGDRALPAVAVLPRHRVTGVVGTGDRSRRLASWLVLQAAAHHSPEDVAVRVLTDASGAADWRWTRWLPHSSAALDEDRAPRVHADPTSVARQIDALLRLVTDRQSAASAARSAGASGGPPAPDRSAASAAPFADGPADPADAARAAGATPDGRAASAKWSGGAPGPASAPFADGPADAAGRAAARGAVPSPGRGGAPGASAPDSAAGAPAVRHRPAVLLVLDGIRRLRTLPGVGRLLQEGPAVGVHLVCLGSEVRQLPAECGYLVDIGDGTGSTAGPAGGPALPVLADLPRPGWFEAAARALAPVRDAGAVRRAADLAALPLPELLGLDVADVEECAGTVEARWSAVPRATAAVVGQVAAAPFALDLRADGPHALVAGRPGSGLVEFLRSWVVSLAVANRPDEMIFVLFDDRGGSAFGPAAELPHVTRVVTDIDAREAERVLGRLFAELRARDARLAAHAVKDVDDYQRLRDRDRSLPPMPRLVLVVAELADLAGGRPELRAGMLDVAQRGRPLGIHLVLATQRPAGSVTEGIRATTNLRIALRLGDAAESAAVVDAPDAAGIPRSSPGRAFVRTGVQELTEFQASVAVDLVSPMSPAAAITVRDLDTPRSVPVHDGAVAVRPADPPGGTDLDLLVAAVRAAALRTGVQPLPGPLPEPLPAVVSLPELPGLTEVPEPPGGAAAPVGVAYGLEELADEVGKQPARFNVAGEGLLAATGGPRTGKSQFLRTLAAALAERHSTADVHLFGVDCGNGALQVLGRLPHCGTVVTRGRPDHLARLVSRLTAALHTRRQLFAEGGFTDLAAQRQAVPADRRLPRLVLLVDRWEGLRELTGRVDGERVAEDLRLLMRDGGPVGIRVVLTADAAGLDERTAALVTDHLVLDRRDKDDYRRLGVDPPLGHLQPGRALRAFSACEVQIALLEGGPSSRGQSDALAALAARLRERDAHVPHTRRPFTIDDAPRAAEQFHVGPGMGRPVGREDVLAWLRDRQSTGASAALLGPRRAGKTWVLEELSRRLAADGGREEVHRLAVPPPSAPVDSPDALAGILCRTVRDAASPAEALLDKAASGGAPLVFLLDEVGRLADYDPVAVSWLRDLGQAGAWLLYTGTEKDWRTVVRRALTAPGSSFGNDVNARLLGPLDEEAALDFLSGTAANLGVAIDRDTTAAAIVRTVGSWPFYLQVVGDAVVRAVQGNDLSPLTGDAALRSLVERRLLDEWSLHFQSRWAEIGPAGRAALLADPGELPARATPAQRQDLRDAGLLRPGEQWLHDPPLLGWIARNDISLRDGETGEWAV